MPSLESGDTPRLTAVAVEDLLLRPSETIDYARLEALINGKAVIVTGGGGSIGSEICERVVAFGAARLLIVENSEPALYAITEALAARGAVAEIEGRIADIRDRDRIMRLMAEFKPDIVFHAAPGKIPWQFPIGSLRQTQNTRRHSLPSRPVGRPLPTGSCPDQKHSHRPR